MWWNRGIIKFDNLTLRLQREGNPGKENPQTFYAIDIFLHLIKYQEMKSGNSSWFPINVSTLLYNYISLEWYFQSSYSFYYIKIHAEMVEKFQTKKLKVLYSLMPLTVNMFYG